MQGSGPLTFNSWDLAWAESEREWAHVHLNTAPGLQHWRVAGIVAGIPCPACHPPRAPRQSPRYSCKLWATYPQVFHGWLHLCPLSFWDHCSNAKGTYNVIDVDKGQTTFPVLFSPLVVAGRRQICGEYWEIKFKKYIDYSLKGSRGDTDEKCAV